MTEPVNQTIHLRDKDLRPESGHCFICGCANLVGAGLLQEAPTIQLLRCTRCGIVSASRMPREEVLAHFYQSYYQKSFYQGRPEKVAVLSPHALAHHIYGCVRDQIKTPNISILDFGGGDGSVSLLLAKRFLADGRVNRISITVIDYDADSRRDDLPEAIVLQRQRDLSSNMSDLYDMIIASAVLEHLTNPREILESLLLRMKPNGLFYARTPYIVPLRQLLALLGVTFDFTYPAHLHDMGSTFWERILTVLQLQDRYRLLRSQPSFVETPYSISFFRALAAHLLKAPWYVLGKRWPLVGGWEVVIKHLQETPKRAK